jgi:peptidoglycan biosynthesis protein MviN/MurJ (putative lipid II flippase)
VAIVGLSLLLGPNGIALGTSLSLMVGGTYFLWLFHKFLKIEPREILAIFGRPLLTGLIGGSVTVLVAWMWPASQGITTKEVVQLGVEFVVYCFLFLAALRVLGVFDDYDRQMIRSMVRGFRSPA